jgi:hypothetical protein
MNEPNDRALLLEIRDDVRQLRARLDSLQGIPAIPPQVVIDPTPTGPITYNGSGLAEPDRRGRVAFEQIENDRANLEAMLQGKNASLPQRFYFEGVSDFYELDETQRAHVVMNTGQNARGGYSGRMGRAVDVERDPEKPGQWRETGNVQHDAWTLTAYTVDDAVAEIRRKVADLASHTDGGGFRGRGD